MVILSEVFFLSISILVISQIRVITQRIEVLETRGSSFCVYICDALFKASHSGPQQSFYFISVLGGTTSLSKGSILCVHEGRWGEGKWSEGKTERGISGIYSQWFQKQSSFLTEHKSLQLPLAQATSFCIEDLPHNYPEQHLLEESAL